MKKPSANRNSFEFLVFNFKLGLRKIIPSATQNSKLKIQNSKFAVFGGAALLAAAGWFFAQGLPVPIAQAPEELVPSGPAPDLIVLAVGDVGGLLETCG